MDNIYEEYERNGLDVKIFYDTDPESPREWDNVGTMICSHRRYTLGDEQFDADDYDSWEDLKQYLIKERKAAIVLPLHLYDHSGITMYIPGDGGYRQHEAWDSGQVGFIYCTQEDIDREWDGDNQKADEYLRGEVNTYDQYLRGDVYGFSITNPKNGEEIDSCWGFYGLEYVTEEVNAIADAFVPPVPKIYDPVNYGVFKELFKIFGVNPHEFKVISGDKVCGFFPNMPKREPLISVDKLAHVLWEGR